jgi:hypothetical protein
MFIDEETPFRWSSFFPEPLLQDMEEDDDQDDGSDPASSNHSDHEESNEESETDDLRYIQAMKGNVDTVADKQQEITEHIMNLETELDWYKARTHRLEEFIERKFGKDELGDMPIKEEYLEKRARIGDLSVDDNNIFNIDVQRSISL